MAQILHIVGSASDRCRISSEQEHHNEIVQALEKSGAEVTVIGNARDGFSKSELKAKLDPEKTTDAIIVDAHGNIEDYSHFMRISPNELIWAHDFYKIVGEALDGHPTNIFMFSCGSGHSLKSAQILLPPNSTVFNLVKPDYADKFNWVDSYGISPESYSIVGNRLTSPAESLFLNMMCKGLPDKWQCNPYLTITSGKLDKEKIHELWILATVQCCNWAGDPFPKDYVKDAKDFLSPHLSKEKFSLALKTMKYYSSLVELSRSPPRKNPGTPVRPQFALDAEHFKGEVIQHGMLGHIGAIAYAIWRDELGAFQRPVVAASTLDL
jgi:hypothetical protein